jgi:sigma-B regulation protein RsbU (phosphoserine phosphatase)
MELVSRLGDAISRSAPSNRYATMFYADLDHQAHRVRFVNAGHAPPPLLIRASGEVQELKAGGTPLGLFAGTEYPIETIELQPGDLLFACSDGVTDLEDPDEEMFGEERLLELLRSLAGRPCDEVRQRLDLELEAHAKETSQTDDLTYIILQRTS